MDNKYIIERDTDSQQVMQFLEEKIYEHNSTAINKDDGQYFSWKVKDQVIVFSRRDFMKKTGIHFCAR